MLRAIVSLKRLSVLFLVISITTTVLWCSLMRLIVLQNSFSFQRFKADKNDIDDSSKESAANTSHKLTMNNVYHPLKDDFASFIATRTTSNSSVTSSVPVCVSELGITESALGIGTASLLLMVLDHISICILAGGKPTVYWRGGLSFEDQEVKMPSFNSWVLFFEPLSMKAEEKANNVICLGRLLHVPDFLRIKDRGIAPHIINFGSNSKENVFDTNYRSLSFKPKPVINLKFRRPKEQSPHIDFEGLISLETRLWVHSLIKKFIKVKKPIIQRAEMFFNNYLKGFNILGVHTRGTDHICETDYQRLPKLDLWIKETELIFSSMSSPKKIFVASDNTESLEKFVDHFGKDVVVFTDALRAAKYDGPNIQQKSPPLQQLAVEVLTDILLLSKCHHFLHGESSVAAVAHYFNLDMKTYFLGELSTGKNASIVNDSDDYLGNANEEDDDFPMMMEYHKKHSYTSVCPDMRLKQFLPTSQLGSFFNTKM